MLKGEEAQKAETKLADCGVSELCEWESER